MQLAQLNFHLVLLMQLNALPRQLAQLMHKLDVHQESELELMVFASGTQQLQPQHADLWFVEMLQVELVLLFVQLDFQDVFQMELNVSPRELVQLIQPRLHAIQEELMEFVSLLHQLPLEQLLEVDLANRLLLVLMLLVIKLPALLLKIDVHGLLPQLEQMQLLANAQLIHVLHINQLLEFVETS